MKNLFDLTGKRALITGGVHGLGMAMAKGLGDAGAELIINNNEPEMLAKAKAEYEAAGYKVSTYVFDVTNDKEVEASIEQIENEVGPIDILINNAGIIKRIPMEDMEAEDFRLVIDIDLVGPFIVSKYVGRKMIARKEGKIININSMMSELGRNSVSAYAAAKGGLKMLTKNMATEWAKHNIQTNGIGPGYFATSQTAPIRVDGHPFNEFILKRTPANRWGDPEDLAGTAVFLSSKASDFVNGQIIYVDGGILATVGRTSEED